MESTGKNKEFKKEEKASKIMAKEISRIVAELKKNKTKTSDRDISAASKKREKEIIKQLISAGLGDGEARLHVLRMKSKIAAELKKAEIEEKRKDKRREKLRELVGVKKKGKEEKKGGKLQNIESESELRKYMTIKIEEIFNEIYKENGEKIRLSPDFKFDFSKNQQLITAEHQGKKYKVILKEINPQTFPDPFVLKIGDLAGTSNYAVKTFSIKNPENEIKNYAVIEKVKGMSTTALRASPVKIRGLEAQYFRELGKIIALTYICAIPGRNTDNIILSRTEKDLKLKTYDFEGAYDYSKHSSLICAQNALDMNTLFFGKIALYHKNDLKDGFVEAFNSAKTKKFRLLNIAKEYAKATGNIGAVEKIKKITFQDPNRIFKKLISTNAILSGDFDFIKEIIINAIRAVDGRDYRGKYIRKFRPLDSRGKPGGLVKLPKKGKLYILTDLQGDLNNFLKFFEDNPKVISELSADAAYLVIAGDMIHGNFIEEESTTQLDLLETVMLLKTKFPDNVYYLLGNHCLGEILGDEAMPIYKKGKFSEQYYFKKLIKEKYKDNYKIIHDGYVKFLKRLPLIVKTENGIIISHTGPIHGWEIKNMEISDEKFINIFLGGYGKDNKELYQMLWNRFGNSFIIKGKGYDTEDIKKFLSDMSAKVMVVGHTPCEGYSIRGNQMVVDSCGEVAGYVILDLTDEDINIEKLKQGFRMFKKGKSGKRFYTLNYEIMRR